MLRVRGLTMTLNDVRSVFLPYCLEQQADGSWIFLNREYKPVGFCTDRWVDYDLYPVRARLKGLRAKMRSGLDHSGRIDGKFVYLYNDGCVPTTSASNMRAYLNRLAILAKLEVDRGSPHLCE